MNPRLIWDMLKTAQDRERWENEIEKKPTKEFSSTDKMVLRDLWGTIKRAEDDGLSGPQPLLIGTPEGHAAQVGLSRGAYARALNRLETCGFIRLDRGKYASGRDSVLIAAGPYFWDPAAAENPAPRRYAHNPKPTCTGCGSNTMTKDTLVWTKITCLNCGEVNKDERVQTSRHLGQGARP